jgi:hypothetical protein
MTGRDKTLMNRDARLRYWTSDVSGTRHTFQVSRRVLGDEFQCFNGDGKPLRMIYQGTATGWPERVAGGFRKGGKSRKDILLNE